MKSAGNDIVALKVIDKQRTCLPAFYSKFITTSEAGIHKETAITFDVFIWLLWSVKEAAYKFFKRDDAALVFSPSKIVIQQIVLAAKTDIAQIQTEQTANVFYKGIAAYGAQKIYFQSTVNDDFIATIVNDAVGFEDVYWGIQLIDKADHASQSKAVRLFALNKLNGLYKSNDLQIDKSPVGYPVLLNSGKEIDIPISFAHHHRYVSYSFQITK